MVEIDSPARSFVIIITSVHLNRNYRRIHRTGIILSLFFPLAKSDTVCRKYWRKIMENFRASGSCCAIWPILLMESYESRFTLHRLRAPVNSFSLSLSLVTSLILKEGIKFRNVIIKNEQRYVRIETELIRRINIEEVVALIQLRWNTTLIKSRIRVVKSRWRVVYAWNERLSNYRLHVTRERFYGPKDRTNHIGSSS